MPITRRFLGWERPVLERVAEELLAETGPPILDLSHLLVVVPTRNAGRRLREMLAHLAAEQGRAICPPQVVPPEFLLSLISKPEAGKLATPTENWLGWVAVLRTTNLAGFPFLFPVPPANQDFRWALHTGRSLTELRNTLGEAGLSIADVGTRLEGPIEEAERWDELARLEEALVCGLASVGLEDVLTARQKRRLDPEIPRGITGIRLAGCPDPLPMALEVIGTLGHHFPVEVWIHAPGEMGESFDSWGRPIPAAWQRRHLPFPGDELAVHVSPDPETQAAQAAAAILQNPEACATITVGVLDDEVTGPLQRLLSQAGQATFNPSGTSLRAEGVLHLVRLLRDLLEEDSYEAFVELLRCPDVNAHLRKEILFWDGPNTIKRFDELFRRHLFTDLRTLRSFLTKGRGEQAFEVISALEEVERILSRLRQAPLPASLRSVLQDLLGARLGDSESRMERITQTVSDVLQPAFEALEGPLGELSQLSPPELLDLALTTLEQETLYEERPTGSVELLGWLELHWDDAPQLIVTGFNEGFAPESITGDVFLPERLRRRLAETTFFPTNETRLARDTYLLEALSQSRREHGRLELCLGKHSRDGNPLRPSRLLFLCPDEELPARVRLLFHDTPPPQGDLPWSAGFQLRPFPGNPPVYQPASLRVTAFQTYLSSPFDFYLRHVEGMQAIDVDRHEMDAMTFGTFCHEVLRLFGQHPEVRESSDADDIRDFLWAAADRLALQWFGPAPALPVRIQLQSARNRLAQAAQVQAQTRTEGWVIEATELDIGNPPLVIDGVPIKGRIDRIDRNRHSGVIRVLDYKTADKAKLPDAAHATQVRNNSRSTWLPDYACFAIGGTTFRWKDLQLPLYRHSLAPAYGDAIECGYFNLPKTIPETSIQVWSSLTPEHGAAAWLCAQGIIGDIRAGRFWPAPRSTEKDEFVRLHLGIPEKTVDFAHLLPSLPSA